MSKLFVIAGHGAGDPGACSGGYKEADLVRKLAARIKALGGSAVTVGDTSVNWYASNYIGRGKCPDGVPVIELHMDSFSGNAKGGHVEIKKGFRADKYDVALGKFIAGFMPGRADAGGIRYRSDLDNMNDAAAMGVNYRLMECGFITNAGDRSKFVNKMDDLARGILAAFGIKASGGGSTSGAFKPYVARVTADVLNVRKGAGTNYGIALQVKKGEAFTIVAEKSGKGSDKGWGKLKSGAGWVSLDWMQRV